MGYIIRGANIPGTGTNISNPNYLSVTADMESAVWNAATTQEVFTVTGLVRARFWIECTETVESGGAATIQFGVEGVTNGFIASTTATELAAGDLWYDASPATVYDTAANAIMDYVINGLDVGYEIGTAALTNGTLVFHCVWEPLNPTGNVAAGAGGAL